MPFPFSLPAAAAVLLAVAIPTAPTLPEAPLHGAPADAAQARADTPGAAEVRAFLDERVPALMEEHGVPGAGVSVVGGGAVLAAEGYGAADLEAGAPVDPARTAFPTASIAKSFTAAAVVELAERGEVDLHADVNTYLPEDERLPDDPRGPVTLHHLLTHTAGFAEQLAGLRAPSEEGILPLGRYVADLRPDRIHPPGRYTGYSNYGYVMAGRVVEEVTGEPFGPYVERTVFDPLGMEHTAFGGPDAVGARLDLPSLYGSGQDGRERLEHPYINGAPAGSAFSAPADMAVFMLELLRERPSGGDVLTDGAVEAMLGRQAANDPRLTGSGYGMWELRTDDPRAIGHGGDGPGVHTQYALVPEDGAGIFVAANGDGTSEGMFTLRDDLVREYLERFHGAGPPEAGGGEQDGGLERYAGTYSMTRIPHREPAEALYAALQTRVSTNGDRLRTADLLSGAAEWVPAGDGVFHAVGGDAAEEGFRLVFIEEEGRVTAMGMDHIPSNAFERVPWYRDALIQGTAAAVSLALALSTLVWPVAAAVRLLRGRRSQEIGRAHV